jgi:integrase
MDAFLDWTHRHRAVRTYAWYRDFCQSFADTLPSALTVVQLKPLHVQRWVDGKPTWNDGNRRGAITAIQRVFRWAQKMGHIDRSPVSYIEKPRAGKRDAILTSSEFNALLAGVKDQPFSDLLTTVWETGCRPQEVISVQARHVDLANSRWVFPPHEAKVKTRPRIVYLPDSARAITERLLHANPSGHLFRNTKGKPWTAMAVNCRFQTLQKKLGRKYCLYLLRHSFATRMLEAGVDALTVAILLGHANPAMLSTTYQHLAHNPQFLLQQARRAS